MNFPIAGVRSIRRECGFCARMASCAAPPDRGVVDTSVGDPPGA
jgi:hypothetical protein